MSKWITIGALFFLSFGATAQADDFTSASCLQQSGVGSAECDAICPSGQLVLNCSYTLGNYSVGDTCTSIERLSVSAADPTGQPYPQPHDRCNVSAICSDHSATI